MEIKQEIWKEVEGFEGLYEVSNFGRVRSIERILTAEKYGRTITRRMSSVILKNKNPSGRDIKVTLWKDKKPKDFLVHRLVALAFLPKIEGFNYVNHIDGNPKNNHVSNLEWCDHKKNNNHAFDNGLIKTGRKIVLVNKETKEAIYFRSASKASLFLGEKDVFIAHLLEKGIDEYKEYEIFVKAAQKPKKKTKSSETTVKKEVC